MLKRTNFTIAIVFGLFIFSFGAFAHAEEAKSESGLSGQEILKKMDATVNEWKDQFMDNTMTIVDIDGSEKSYDFKIWQKGTDKRMIRFASGEKKGLSMLIMNKNQVYVMLPGSKRVRRISQSNMNQTFAGSDFTNDDMATAAWSKDWNASLEKDDEKLYHLKATPKKGVKSQYAYLKIQVHKSDSRLHRLEYYNEKGEMVKLMETATLKKFGDETLHTNITMSDPRTGHKTKITVKDLKVNQGLKDSFFSKRRLTWGR